MEKLNISDGTLSYEGFNYTSEFKRDIGDLGLDVVKMIDLAISKRIVKYVLIGSETMSIEVDIENKTIKGEGKR